MYAWQIWVFVLKVICVVCIVFVCWTYMYAYPVSGRQSSLEKKLFGSMQ